ncbi:BamA/TamA family outer membrane protein [Myxococcota bacterium]|nr:BamA/TamA family outer membrane protein [Myxococcota bacterium]MBU1431718.1 BamA/TamA family outer membrane protein [Myxococcota bacterium]MBU1896696.1 BamA/TamA family outer membrane protein [Myxococcota bacterium]
MPLPLLAAIFTALLSPPSSSPTSHPAPLLTQRPLIESIRLLGVNPIRRAGLRERLAIEPGAPLDEAAISAARLWLLSTGLFERVEPRLERGSQRGHVHLVFDCTPRPTLSLDRVYLGHARPTRLWLGGEVSDLDPLGLGFSGAVGAVGAARQQAGFLRLSRPGLLWRGLGVQLELRGVNGEEPWVGPISQRVGGAEVAEIPLTYQRLGAEAQISGGAGLRWSAGLRGEWVTLRAPQGARVQDQAGAWRPLPIVEGDHLLIAALGGLSYDTRDNPLSPTRGLLLDGFGQLSHYDGAALRLEGGFARYIPLAWDHVLGISGRAGLIWGEAAFFDRFFIGDWHPYLPYRALGLNFSRRRGPMLLDRALQASRYEDLAGRLSLVYRVPIGDTRHYRTEIYLGLTALTLTSPGAPGPIPFDAAADFGLRIESELGVLSLGLSESLLLLDP